MAKKVTWLLASIKHKKTFIIYSADVGGAKLLTKPSLFDSDPAAQRRMLEQYAMDAHMQRLGEADRVEPIDGHKTYISRAKILQEFIVEIPD